MGIAMSPNQENLYVADFFHNLVRRVNMTSSTYFNSLSIISTPNLNETSVSFSLLLAPSNYQCLYLSHLVGYLKGFDISYRYSKPDYYGDAWASDLFLILRALNNEGCYQWGGFLYEVTIQLFSNKYLL
jgi:hypothetical protein